MVRLTGGNAYWYLNGAQWHGCGPVLSSHGGGR